MAFVIFCGKAQTGTRTLSGGQVGAVAALVLVAVLGVGVVLGAAFLPNFALDFSPLARHATAQETKQALLNHIDDLSTRIAQLELEAGGLASQMGTIQEFEARMRMDDVTVRQGPRAKTQPAPDGVVSGTGGVFLPVGKTDALKQTDALDDVSAHDAVDTADALNEPPLADDSLSEALSILPENLALKLGAVHADLNRLSHALAGLDEHAQQVTLAHMAFPGRRPVKEEDSWISSYFGKRRDPFNTRQAFHSGIDFAAYRGTPIYASAGGKVAFAGNRPGYGKTVEIDHGNGMVTRYAHTLKILVKKNQLVMPGQLLAQVGSTGRSTGAHLHFEIIKDGHFVDPWPYLARF